jgi:hypothetical protein
MRCPLKAYTLIIAYKKLDVNEIFSFICPQILKSRKIYAIIELHNFRKELKYNEKAY